MVESPSEVVLTGGNVAGRVVRIGTTVRKPATRATPAVEALLGHLNRAEFEGSPRSLGRDEAGRHVLEYVPGDMADTLPPMSVTDLRRLGRLIRRFHDVAESFRPPAGAQWDVVIPPDRHDLICHHDLAPWNLVRSQDRWVFIDWDGAGLDHACGILPTPRTASFRWPPPATQPPTVPGSGHWYGLDEQQRRCLPALTGAHTRAMYDLLRSSAATGAQPWARLYAEGHARHWGPAADYIDHQHDQWLAALLD